VFKVTGVPTSDPENFTTEQVGVLFVRPRLVLFCPAHWTREISHRRPNAAPEIPTETSLKPLSAIESAAALNDGKIDTLLIPHTGWVSTENVPEAKIAAAIEYSVPNVKLSRRKLITDGLQFAATNRSDVFSPPQKARKYTQSTEGKEGLLIMDTDTVLKGRFSTRSEDKAYPLPLQSWGVTETAAVSHTWTVRPESEKI
jgi:hypothetical protein